MSSSSNIATAREVDRLRALAESRLMMLIETQASLGGLLVMLAARDRMIADLVRELDRMRQLADGGNVTTDDSQAGAHAQESAS